MTPEDLAAARRMMTLCVPRGAAAAGGNRIAPVSFCLIAVSQDELVFRMVDQRGSALDMALNPVVAGALRDVIALSDRLAGPEPLAKGSCA